MASYKSYIPVCFVEVYDPKGQEPIGHTYAMNFGSEPETGQMLYGWGCNRRGCHCVGNEYASRGGAAKGLTRHAVKGNHY